MTKIQVIANDDCRVFQESINNFIKDKNVTDIKFQSVVHQQTTDGVLRNYINDRALIIYQE